MKRIICSCLFFLAAINAHAQGSNSLQPLSAPSKNTAIRKIKPLRAELSGGLRLNTDGWGLFVERGTVRSSEKFSDQFYNVRFFQVEFSERKHPKEIKRTNTLGTTANDKPTPFIYGKANNMYSLKLGYGGRKMIAGKPEAGNVSIHWVYLGGLSLGLLKPYYVDAYIKDNTGSIIQESITYTTKNKEAFLVKENIIGSSGFSKGIGETKIVPGFHFKTAAHFDFASAKHSKLAIETGVNFEYYTSAIELMATQDAKAFFVNAYVSFQFGKRW